MPNERREGWGLVAAFAVLHLLCCGVPLMVLSGVSLGVLFPKWPVAAGRAGRGRSGRVHLVREAEVRNLPRNEGRCMTVCREGTLEAKEQTNG